MSKGAFNNPATETLDKVIQTEKEENLLAQKTMFLSFSPSFLASQDALEVIVWVSQWVSEWVTLRTELTDVTLVSEDTYWRLYWQDSGN